MTKTVDGRAGSITLEACHVKPKTNFLV